jgi:hypothetical protein
LDEAGETLGGTHYDAHAELLRVFRMGPGQLGVTLRHLTKWAWESYIKRRQPHLRAMPHRSIAQPGLDDTAFPVRLKLRVPELGFGNVLIEMLRWLREELGESNFARHDTSTFDHETLAFYFRRLDDAAAFLSAFPKLELADGTTSRTYTAPSVPGRRAR